MCFEADVCRIFDDLVFISHQYWISSASTHLSSKPYLHHVPRKPSSCPFASQINQTNKQTNVFTQPPQSLPEVKAGWCFALLYIGHLSWENVPQSARRWRWNLEIVVGTWTLFFASLVDDNQSATCSYSLKILILRHSWASFSNVHISEINGHLAAFPLSFKWMQQRNQRRRDITAKEKPVRLGLMVAVEQKPL